MFFCYVSLIELGILYVIQTIIMYLLYFEPIKSVLIMSFGKRESLALLFASLLHVLCVSLVTISIVVTVIVTLHGHLLYHFIMGEAAPLFFTMSGIKSQKLVGCDINVRLTLLELHIDIINIHLEQETLTYILCSVDFVSGPYDISNYSA